MHLIISIELRIPERAGHHCSMNGSRTRKENVKRENVW
jgi:hypothetical protein